MGAFGENARVALVWLTAALTLFAGTPRLQCRCPEGPLQPSCLGLFPRANAASCCCAHEDGPASPPACCAPSSDPRPPTDAEPSCCARREGTRATEGVVAAADRASPSPCVRALSAPADVTPPRAEANEAEDPATAALSSPQPFPASSPRGQGTSPAWAPHLAPPPTDLLTALHRLLI
jgi:hypothetical protein